MYLWLYIYIYIFIYYSYIYIFTHTHIYIYIVCVCVWPLRRRLLASSLRLVTRFVSHHSVDYPMYKWVIPIK